MPKTLAMRTHSCNNCGLKIARDYNAAKNIQFRGLEQLGRLDLLLSRGRGNLRL
ncbi:transposase [Candidatus Nitrososphaera gargensis]